MKDLTPEDLSRAATAGMDAAEKEHASGTKPRALGRSELWHLVMGDADQSTYRAGAVSELREAFERGRSDFW